MLWTYFCNVNIGLDDTKHIDFGTINAPLLSDKNNSYMNIEVNNVRVIGQASHPMDVWGSDGTYFK